jgi:hypothetical protein
MRPDLQLHWLDTGTPGPNVLVPVPLLAHWSGNLPPKDGRVIKAEFRWQPGEPATDYDRACDVNRAAQSIPVGVGQAIVLYAEGAMPVAWTPLEPGGILLAKLYTIEEPGLPEQLPDTLTDLSWELLGEYASNGSLHRLMHAAEVGEEEPVFDTMDIPIAAGDYRLESATLHDPRMELWLVRLQPKDDRSV